MTKQSTISNASIPNYLHATGKVRYRMTNDYLFRAVFQTNQKALTGLLCSLLHLRPEDISDVTIRNPIVLRETLDEKTFILDISVLLNQNHIINLEMQIVNEGSWPERSLSYLCRTFDDLTKGDSYSNVTPVTQICFLDFDLFPESPEFYATYKMLNIKNNHLYSDKFVLSVINLNQITLATEEDKKNHIDDWAALFRTTEWEEIKMLAQNNEYIKEAIAQAEAMMTQAKQIELEAAQKIVNAEAKQDALLAELLTLRKELEAQKMVKICTHNRSKKQ